MKRAKDTFVNFFSKFQCKIHFWLFLTCLNADTVDSYSIFTFSLVYSILSYLLHFTVKNIFASISRQKSYICLYLPVFATWALFAMPGNTGKFHR